MERPIIELNMYGRDYEQELRPLIRAFLPEAEFDVTHEEADEESMQFIFAKEDAPLLLCANAAYDYSFCLLLMQDWYRLRIYRRGELLADARAQGVNPERKAYRNQVAREIYRALLEAEKKELPWGILTGVRPTKQVYEAIAAGVPEEEIRRHMKEDYFCSDEKIDVSLTVSRREYELLTQLEYQNGYSIYIGIPFCPTTCHYCSFPSYPMESFGHLSDAYLDALSKELCFAGQCFRERRLCTVYVGGGTPTALSESQLARLLELIHRYLPMEHVVEFTVEAGRPDSVTKKKLELIQEFGATRISINPQTMQQRTLDLIGRRHTVEQIREAFRLARSLGYDNINMDIIIGLTGETPEDVEKTLAEIAELSPDSLTVHTLAKKRAARLTTQKELYEGMEAVGVTSMLEKTVRFAKEQAYFPYYLYRQKNMAENLENVGYARRGKEGLYNILIMEEKQTILALGAGATSKFIFPQGGRIERVENVKSLKDYIERIDEMIQRKRNFLEGAENLWI